ncbi:Aste57867_17361 [Aphanomyces stellatus]|uniref:Aste57867_17361 protein n=1 Tax=Aphanomyces stellatus TaxID=120398 RepID=A0A485L8C6_9STRA|nr:hypothetical protein As57867_017301 [Aphanomyces stellatus]VFT94117.1 Aste57867_17361 [Aphanomyces stellatus]
MVPWPTSLTNFNLAQNKINALDATGTFPATLNFLDLSQNQLSVFPTTAWPDALDTLHLHDNPIGAIPVDQPNSHICTRHLGSTGFRALPTSLPPNLQFIELSKIPLNAFPRLNQQPQTIEDMYERLLKYIVHGFDSDLSTTGLHRCLIPLRGLKNLGRNAITAIPDDDFAVPKFTTNINLGNNRIARLPANSSWRRSLASLDLSNNQLENILKGTKLPRRSVTVEGNNITALVDLALSQLFFVDKNPLQVIPNVTFPEDVYLYVCLSTCSSRDPPTGAQTPQVELTEFTLRSGMFSSLKRSTQAEFGHPNFRANAQSIQISCDSRNGKVNPLSPTISICVA